MCIGEKIAKWTTGLFVPATVVLLLLLTIAYNLFQPQFLKQVFVEQNIYPRFTHLAAEQLVFIFHRQAMDMEFISFSSPKPVPNEGFRSFAPYLSHLSRSDWELILNDIVPEGWVQAQLEGLVDQMTGALLQQETTTPIKISLVDVKARLLSEAGMMAFLRLVEAQPACIKGKSAVDASLRHSVDVLCRPDAAVLEQLKPQYRQMLAGITAQIPDEIELGKMLKSFLPADSFLLKALIWPSMLSFPLIRWVRLALLAGLLVPLGMLILAARLAGWKLSDVLRHWGLALFLAGLFGCGLALAGLPAVNSVISDSLIRSSSWYITRDLVQILLGVVGSMSRSLGKWLGLESYILVCLGAVLLAVHEWFIIRRSNREDVAEPASRWT